MPPGGREELARGRGLVHGAHADAAELADRAGAEAVSSSRVSCIEVALEPHLEADFLFADNLGNAQRGGQIRGDGLLAEQRDIQGGGALDNGGVRVRWGGDYEAIEVWTGEQSVGCTHFDTSIWVRGGEGLSTVWNRVRHHKPIYRQGQDFSVHHANAPKPNEADRYHLLSSFSGRLIYRDDTTPGELRGDKWRRV